jgi:hypothetical protein
MKMRDVIIIVFLFFFYVPCLFSYILSGFNGTEKFTQILSKQDED